MILLSLIREIINRQVTRGKKRGLNNEKGQTVFRLFIYKFRILVNFVWNCETPTSDDLENSRLNEIFWKLSFERDTFRDKRYERESFVISRSGGYAIQIRNVGVRGEGRNVGRIGIHKSTWGGGGGMFNACFSIVSEVAYSRCYSFHRFTGSRCIVRIADIVIGFDAFPVSFWSARTRKRADFQKNGGRIEWNLWTRGGEAAMNGEYSPIFYNLKDRSSIHRSKLISRVYHSKLSLKAFEIHQYLEIQI